MKSYKERKIKPRLYAFLFILTKLFVTDLFAGNEKPHAEAKVLLTEIRYSSKEDHRTQIPPSTAVQEIWYKTMLAKIIFAALLICLLGLFYWLMVKQRLRRHIEQKKQLQIIIDEKTSALKQANKILKRAAYRDNLTGLSNRMYLDKYIKKLIQYEVNQLSVVMFDMDYFKDYNDQYGHLAGDEILKSLAKTLRDNFRRSSSLIARFGGEEFLVILPYTPEKHALRISEAVRKSIKTDLKNVTVSAGLTSTDSNFTLDSRADIFNLIHQADQALYQSKKNGRDQIRIFPDVKPLVETS